MRACRRVGRDRRSKSIVTTTKTTVVIANAGQTPKAPFRDSTANIHVANPHVNHRSRP